MIAIPWVPGNKETSKEIRNRKICPRTKRSPAPYAKHTKTAGLDYHARCFPDLS